MKDATVARLTDNVEASGVSRQGARAQRRVQSVERRVVDEGGLRMDALFLGRAGGGHARRRLCVSESVQGAVGVQSHVVVLVGVAGVEVVDRAEKQRNGSCHVGGRVVGGIVLASMDEGLCLCVSV